MASSELRAGVPALLLIRLAWARFAGILRVRPVASTAMSLDRWTDLAGEDRYMTGNKKITPGELCALKQRRTKICAVVTYSYTMALIADRAGIDLVLVGDSAARVVSGRSNFLSVQLAEMIYHSQAVSRACRRACVMSDLPEKTIVDGVQACVTGAMALLADGGADCVKVEGGSDCVLNIVEGIANAGIPVVGHFGMPSARVDKVGAYRVKAELLGMESGHTLGQQMVKMGRVFQDAGCCALLLAKMPSRVAADITNAVEIPTIGIGSGAGCDGQILILEELLGLLQREPPYYAKRYVEGAGIFEEAIRRYAEDVREGGFPDKEHTLGAGGTGS
jgi:3-methyl-2-oxobutanoate hydroxymethyltransferase